MAEKTILTTPVSELDWSIARIIYDWEGAAIYIVVRFSNGRKKDYQYSGATATTLIKAINKANCAIKSQQLRIMEQLRTDFPELAGTTNGLPD